MSKLLFASIIALIFLTANAALFAETLPAQAPEFYLTATLPPTPTPTDLPVLDTNNARATHLIFSALEAWPTSLVWYPDSSTLAVISSENLMLYTVSTERGVAGNPRSWAEEWGWSAEESIPFSGVAIGLSPDGNMLAVANLTGGMEIYLLDTRDGRLLYTLTGVEFPRRISFSSDAQYLAVAGNDLRVWALSEHSPAPELVYQSDNSYVNSLAFAPDNSLAIGDGFQLSILEPETFALRYNIGVNWSISEIAIRPNSYELAATGSNGLSVWNIQTGEQIKAPVVLGYWPSTLAYSPDGALLVLSASNRTYYDLTGLLHILDAENLNVLSSLDLNFWETSLAFSPDGRLLATTGREAILHLWGVFERP